MATDETCDPDLAPDGAELFHRTWVAFDPRSPAGDGLGPVFNDVSCAVCHTLGGPGGAGPNDKNVVLEIDEEGVTTVDHKFPVDGAARSSAFLGKMVLSSRSFAFGFTTSVERSTPALFGAGLIDAIPDGVLWTQAALGHGRVATDLHGRPGRFGWKGQTSRLATFVEDACANELGLQTAAANQPGPDAPGLDMDDAMLASLTEHVASLPRPQRLTVPGAAAGEAVFAQVGCDACHVPDLGDVSGLYSDLLLHDMGSGLADAASGYAGHVTATAAHAGAAEAREWRTAPLWGLRDSAPYLHDGRANTVEQAIELHGGEAHESVRAWHALPDADRSALRAFLTSLAAPLPTS